MSYSLAFKKFEERLAEVSHLRMLSNIYVSYGRAKFTKESHSNALIRSATVLLSSHIQGYVEDLSDFLIEQAISSKISAEKIPDRFRFQIIKRELSELAAESDHDKAIGRLRKLIDKRAELLDASGELPGSAKSAAYKDGFGNPTTSEIGKFLRRFGIEDFNLVVKKRLGSNYFFASNAVDQIVDRRTKIAHGDHLATLTAKELANYIILVRRYCSATDQICCSHFRSLGCKFR